MKLCLSGSCLFSSPVLKEYTNIDDNFFWNPFSSFVFHVQSFQIFACVGGKYYVFALAKATYNLVNSA